jgi:hypothetical protein
MVHHASDPNRKRRSPRTHLCDLGKLRRLENETRLGKNGGAIAGSRKASISQFKAPKFKRKAWGGREKDGKLTQANKKNANPPVSFDGL